MKNYVTFNSPNQDTSDTELKSFGAEDLIKEQTSIDRDEAYARYI